MAGVDAGFYRCRTHYKLGFTSGSSNTAYLMRVLQDCVDLTDL